MVRRAGLSCYIVWMSSLNCQMLNYIPVFHIPHLKQWNALLIFRQRTRRPLTFAGSTTLTSSSGATSDFLMIVIMINYDDDHYYDNDGETDHDYEFDKRSSLGSFYIPCIIMVVLYSRIFKVKIYEGFLMVLSLSLFLFLFLGRSDCFLRVFSFFLFAFLVVFVFFLHFRRSLLISQLIYHSDRKKRSAFLHSRF